jgi:hypothetical protein
MSIIDRLIAAVTPPESDEARLEARTRATRAALPGDWLDQILQHHMDIEDAFADVRAAPDAASRAARLKQLALVLTGHAIAEEAVIYPAMANEAQKTHAGMGYDEQALVKVQFALLERLDPMSQQFLDKLGHVESAVQHHMYQEEGDWFLELKDSASLADEAMLTRRYAEEYERYVGAPSLA